MPETAVLAALRALVMVAKVVEAVQQRPHLAARSAVWAAPVATVATLVAAVLVETQVLQLLAAAKDSAVMHSEPAAVPVVTEHCLVATAAKVVTSAQ